MEFRKVIIINLLILVLSSSFIAVRQLTNEVNASTAIASAYTDHSMNYELGGTLQNLLADINYTAIDSHLRFFSGIPSRITGWPGAEIAADYIYSKFYDYGLNPFNHYYNITTLSYKGSGITILDHPEMNLSLYPLEPNLVVPVTCSMTAPIIYGGSGRLEELNGKQLNGSIVLMDFNSGDRWLNAAKLGAKGVIFIEPEETSINEINSKSINLALYFPRFYMSRQDAMKILNLLVSTEDVYAHVFSKMVWELKTARNIVGIINGTDFPDKVIILSAYYDSDGIVPNIAPGVNEATGIASLMEMARLLSKPEYKPKYTVMFVAFSGHNQYIQGARWFIYDFLWRSGSQYQSLGLRDKLILQIQLQLSSESDYWTIMAIGEYGRTLHCWRNDYPRLNVFATYVLGLASSIDSELPNDHKFANSVWQEARYYPYGTLLSDSETVCMSEGPGYSFATVDSFHYYRSPLDNYGKLNWNNLKNQLEIMFPVLYSVVVTEDLYSKYLAAYKLQKQDYLTAKVGVYNHLTGWYDPLPGAVFYVFSEANLGGGGVIGPLLRPIPKGWAVLTDENGYFFTPEIHSGKCGPGARWQIYAYKIDPETGQATYAPDFGQYHFSDPRAANLEIAIDLGWFVLFRCTSVVLYDIADSSFAETEPIDAISIVEHNSKTRLEHFGFHMQKNIAVLYLPKDEPVDILFEALYLPKTPIGILVNASDANPLGTGYTFHEESQFSMIPTTLKISQEIYHVTSYYVDVLNFYGLGGNLPKRLEDANTLIKNSTSALENRRYDEALSTAMGAWSLLTEIYADARSIYQDVITTVPFFAALVLPAVFLMERFFFRGSGLKRILALAGLFTLIVALLFFRHPGFLLASNPIMLVIGFVILILIAPVVGVLSGIFSSTIRRVARKIRGLHFAEISRGSAMMLSFSLGVENIRKRKLRSVLLFTTILLIVVALTMFSSISAIKARKAFTSFGTPLYQGVFLKREVWYGVPFPEGSVEILRAMFGGEAEIFPRSTAYHWAGTDMLAFFNMTYGEKSLQFYAVQGYSPYEPESVKDTIIKGRWFIPTDQYACIITDEQAQGLGIKEPGAKISALGLNWTIVGIIDSTTFNRLKGPDEQQITPYDRRIPNQDFLHVASDESFMIPFDTSLQIGRYEVQINSIGIAFKDSSVIPNATASCLSYFPRLVIYQVLGNTTTSYVFGQSYTSFGVENQIIPFAMSCLLILNTMIGNVQERRREIGTYASVGLSPLHISFLFLAESSIFAVVGGTVGYVISMFIVSAASSYLTGLVINYTSTWVIIVFGLAMLATILSTIYPMRVASRLVTPSLERVWRAPTKPGLADWEVPLPFAFSDEEIVGLSVFMAEFLREHESERAEVFSVRKLVYEEHIDVEKPFRQFTADLRLEPYELGIVQQTQIVFMRDPETARWQIDIIIKRISGRRETWIKQNLQLIDRLRKQFLIWRSLTSKDTKSYAQRSEELKQLS